MSMSSPSPSNTFIIDTGSSTIKAGSSQNELPALIVPSVVAEDRDDPTGEKGGWYLGKEALTKASRAWDLVRLRYSISCGMVMDWDHTEALWDLVMEQLSSSGSNDYSQMNVVLPVHPLTPTHHLESIAEIMLETFNINHLSLINSAIASVGVGQTGIAIESGEGSTTVSMVINGMSGPALTSTCPALTGNSVSSFLRALLPQDTVASLADYKGSKVLRHIKHQLCYVSHDFDQDLQRAKREPSDYEQIIEMSNGESLSLGIEAFMVPEMIFDPSIAGVAGPHQGLGGRVVSAVKQLDSSLRRPLLSNITLGGGNVMFEGLSERLSREIRSLLGSGSAATVNITDNEPSLYRVYEGCVQYVQNQHTSKDRWVSRQMWEESGMKSIRDNCLV